MGAERARHYSLQNHLDPVARLLEQRTFDAPNDVAIGERSETFRPRGHLSTFIIHASVLRSIV